MNHIEKMLQDYCPNGVEWKELGDREVAKLSRGKVMSKQFLEENKGVFPVYSSQTANSGEIGKISTFDFDGEYITWTTDGANAGTVFYRQGKFSITNVCGLVDIQNDKLLTKFVYYYLTITTKKYVSSGMGNPKLMSNVMAKIKIPIPPLEIQEEIVKILDKFTEYVTELTAELTAELTLRQKQYNYFRDYLLNFDSDSSGGANNKVYQVEWKTLGEVGLPTENISWKSQGEQCFSYIDLSSVDRDSKKITETTEITKYTAPSRAQKIVKENDIIFGTTRPTLRRYAKIPLEFDNQICSTGFYVFRASDEVLPNYIYHILGSNAFNNFVEENQSGASYPAISNSLVEQYKLPVPSKKVQSRIVEVLDNFDAVCNDLNIGLPKEIELRQKQYEYFREKLLTFTAEGVYTDSTVQYSTVQTRPD
ncbi:restriction endonuclease subunit S [Streptococcus suis]